MHKTAEYERLIEAQSNTMKDLQDMLEKVAKRYGNWIEKFPEYSIQNFTFIDNYGVVHNSPAQYVDKHGQVHDKPLQFLMEDGIVHDTLALKRASSHHHCRYVGHTRQHCKRSRSPCNRLKGIQHEEQKRMADLECELNTSICHSAWEDKRRVQLESEIENLREEMLNPNRSFSRLERAYVASSTSYTTTAVPADIVTVNTDTEIDQDEAMAKSAARYLQSEMQQIDAYELTLTRLKDQENIIETLTREFIALRRDNNHNGRVSVSTQHTHTDHPHSLDCAAPNDATKQTVVPAGLSHTINTMLERYDTLDQSSKNELLKHAIATGNENLQSRLLML